MEERNELQREEQRWISRFERKINFRHSRRIIDYPILAANLFDLFSARKKKRNERKKEERKKEKKSGGAQRTLLELPAVRPKKNPSK